MEAAASRLTVPELPMCPERHTRPISPPPAPLQASYGGGGDAFVTKIDAAGSTLVYSTYLGGAGYDLADGLAVDSSGNAYVTGCTQSTNFPTASPLQASNGGGACDGFVTKINAAGTALVYSTYLGGSGVDAGFGIAVDSSGNAYVDGFGQARPISPPRALFSPNTEAVHTTPSCFRSPGT